MHEKSFFCLRTGSLLIAAMLFLVDGFGFATGGPLSQASELTLTELDNGKKRAV